MKCRKLLVGRTNEPSSVGWSLILSTLNAVSLTLIQGEMKTDMIAHDASVRVLS